MNSNIEVIQVGNCCPTKTRANPNQGRIYDIAGIAPCLNQMGGGNRQPMVIHYLRIRKLTPKECWRLMGFDDADFEKAEAVNSNTQLYKQAGNSIVVDVLEHLIKGVIDMRLWTDNPERDAEMHYEDTKSKKIGVCEHCSDPIYDYEEYYVIHGDMIHDDCLRDWAEQYKVS